MNPIRILLVDDHAIVRAGFRALLGTLQGVSVVGEASDGYEALDELRRLRPDIALVDVAMPGLNGLEVAFRARKVSRKTRVLMLTMYNDDQYVRRAEAIGAAGFVLKQTSVTELELALRSASEGRAFFGPHLSLALSQATEPASRAAAGPFEVLTSRQREVLQLIGEGHTTKSIALRLNLSVKTVDAHRAEVLRRTGLASTPELVCYAIRTGLARR